MDKQLINKFNELEKDRLSLCGQVKSLSDAERNFRLNSDKWSVIQTLLHIVKSEQLTAISIAKNIENKKKLKTRNLGAAVRSRFLSVALKTPFKFKAPPLLANMPENYDHLELIKKWENVRNNFNKIITETSGAVEDKMIFNHPKAGWLDLNQTLLFLKDHFDHHNRQIQNLIRHQKNS